MKTIDKVIKQCFKDTKQYFLMMIVGGFCMTFLIASLVGIVIAPVTMILVVVGIIKALIYLFEKSLYSEEAMIYQMLPVSADQIIVSRVFVGMVAIAVFWISVFQCILIGFPMVISNMSINDMVEFVLSLLYKMGMATTITIAIASVTNLFFEVTVIFGMVTFMHTTAAAKDNGMVRVAIMLGMLGLLRSTAFMLPEIGLFGGDNSQLKIVLILGVFIVFTTVVGCIMCKLIKNRLENNLQL
ncbi:MAG: hypothetical protein IKU53_00725 [Firmicutes bacterium]|nr:hypothetical protein [Bacillota bacterium]